MVSSHPEETFVHDTTIFYFSLHSYDGRFIFLDMNYKQVGSKIMKLPRSLPFLSCLPSIACCSHLLPAKDQEEKLVSLKYELA